MKDQISETRAKIAEIGKLLFDRQLTDTAGGNISARAIDLYLIQLERFCRSSG